MAALRRSRPSTPGSARQLAGFLVAIAVIAVVWELVKWFGGDPWHYESFLGTGLRIDHVPPFQVYQASDINLPHVWDVVGSFVAVDAAGKSGIETLLGAALFTLRGALVGFALGAAVGLALAVLLVHVPVLERALVPLVVASQTVPIVALAPIIVVGLQAGWFGIAIVASYLTFFPVTIAAIRGLRAADPRAIELMRSYAASRWTVLWKLRFPTALPYLFAALKVSATASIVGAIIGESPSSIAGGLGGAILNFAQYYSFQPQNLWATNLIAALLGVVFFLIVVGVEKLVVRRAPENFV